MAWSSERKKLRDAPVALKSKVWSHFRFYSNEDGTKLEKNNTTNMHSHLLRHHPELVNPKAMAVSNPARTSMEALFQAKLPYNSPSAKAITHRICKDLQPYSVVENFSYDIPRRKYFTEKKIPALYEETKAGVMNALESAERVGLTCDSWTSRATQSYITITAHFIKPHTGVHIAEVLQKAVDEWKIDTKQPVVITDNASNMTVAMELTSYQHVRCFAHVLKLASQHALKVNTVARLLDKIRRISNYFHRSTIGAQALKRNQSLLGLTPHKLITDMSVRWNSAYEMVSRFLKQQPAICAVLLKNVIDISNAEEIVEALKPMLVATNIMCEEKSPTISITAPLQAQLLSDTVITSEDSPLGAIHQDLLKRCTFLEEKDLLHISSDLDPRFKSLRFMSPEEVQDTYAKLLSKAVECKEGAQVLGQQLQEDSEEMPHTNGDKDKADCELVAQNAKKRKSARVDLLGQTFKNDSSASFQSESTRALAEREIKQYQDAASLPLTEDLLLWWKSQAHVDPLLSKRAQMYLCIPGTSVAATVGDNINDKRCVLTPEHANQLLFLKKNIIRDVTIHSTPDTIRFTILGSRYDSLTIYFTKWDCRQIFFFWEKKLENAVLFSFYFSLSKEFLDKLFKTMQFN
uniref:HAT C-terminal dimerisation domain-containing protein n=1 Tax=Gouania willdenowi TaxID=441366 RepID=A0A8C5NDS7_GOUWI